MEYTKTIKDLPKEKVLATIKNRPWTAQIAMAILGVLILIFYLQAWPLALFIIVITGLSILLTKDYTTCLVFEGKIAIFNPSNQQEIEIINFEEVVTYQLDQKAAAYVAIVLKSDNENEANQVVVQTFQASRLVRSLFKQMPDKDHERMKITGFRDSLSKKRKDRKQKEKK